MSSDIEPLRRTANGRYVPVAPMSSEGPVATIQCDNLVKIYKVADLEVVALQGLDLHVERAEMIALVGASGSGKSTLMNILGGLDVPSAGRATVAGHDLTRMDGRARTTYRRRVVGFIWQQTERNLLSHLSAAENVELPMLLDGVSARERRQRATLLMDLVGVPVARRAGLPTELSGGEQQRVAVAIALANQPPVLLADEPTGELDGATAAELLSALRRVNAELGTTIVIVTHDPLVSDHVQRTIAIRDGRTSTETVHRDETEQGIIARHAGGASAVRVSEEYAVLDQAGRLQLPRAHVEALGLTRRVKLRLESDHIGIWPDQDAAVASRPGPPGPSSALSATRPAPEPPQAIGPASYPITAADPTTGAETSSSDGADDAPPAPAIPQPPRSPQR
jgi:putative ABC transport system ATP-binding protein